MRLSKLLSTGFWMVAWAISALCAQPPAPKTPERQPNEAKGMPPRVAPTDYQTQGKAGAITIAAEFTGHAVSTPDAVYNSDDYVAVEVAFFGPPEARLKLTADDFSLRINGKKGATPSANSVLILKSLKDPNWEPPGGFEPKSKSSSLSTGGSKSDSPPAPVHMPMELQHVMNQRVQNAALLEGDRALPIAGLLFFQYHGKPESIHSLELIYNGAAGQATLNLQP